MAQDAPGKVTLEVVFVSDAGFASNFRNRDLDEIHRDLAAIRGAERMQRP